MESLCVAVLCIFVAGFQSVQGATWSYVGERGVDNWATNYQESCAGLSNSPIDLVDSKVTYSMELEAFKFHNFDSTTGVTWTLGNNGHTVQVTVNSGVMQVSGGSLGDTYQVAQFHFHWGSTSSKGSEHTVNGLAYPMEVHIVCFNTKYGNIGSAVANTDGLAVLGFFFEISPNTNPTIQKIVDELHNIKHPNNQTVMTPFPIDDMMAGAGNYYRYQGGLTTPPCSEIVTWTVFFNTIKISEAQMSAFRTLIDVDNMAMVDNFRPVQDLNDRKIFASFYKETFSASASGLVFSSLALVLSTLASLWCRL